MRLSGLCECAADDEHTHIYMHGRELWRWVLSCGGFAAFERSAFLFEKWDGTHCCTVIGLVSTFLAVRFCCDPFIPLQTKWTESTSNIPSCNIPRLSNGQWLTVNLFASTRISFLYVDFFILCEETCRWCNFYFYYECLQGPLSP